MTRDIDVDVRTHLRADATIAGLIGDRIYPNLAPLDAVFPNIVYSPVDENDECYDGFYYRRIRYSCWTQDTDTVDGYTQLKSLVAAVKSRMLLATTFTASLAQSINAPNPELAIYGRHLHYNMTYKEV